MKVRCALKSCKKYVPREEAYRVGIQSFCDQQHYVEYGNTPSKTVKKKKADIPDELRDLVYELDGYQCRFCRSRSNLHLHHVFYRSEGGLHEQSNLLTLCMDCHNPIVHADKKRWQPLCLGVIWLRSQGDKHTTVPLLEKRLQNGFQ